MSAGSVRGTTIDGLSFNVAADASIALTPRKVKTSIPHSGGNMQQVTLVPANATGIKLILKPSEYNILEGLAENKGIPLSYEMADGSIFRTVGEVNLGDYLTEDSSCEVEYLTDTGKWEGFSET